MFQGSLINQVSDLKDLVCLSKKFNKKFSNLEY